MWPETGSLIPSVGVVAKPATQIADMAGISLPSNRRFLVVEENGVGPDHPFSGEKLSVVLTLYRYEGGIENAVRLVNAITNYQGRGHTCGIHTRSDDHVMALALGTKTGRVLVNQNLNEGAGSLRNGLPYTLSLSCGTWGGQHHHRKRECQASDQLDLGLASDRCAIDKRAISFPGALGSIRKVSLR